ncbi:MAG: hypothetical protein HYT13_02315 [Candidatus Liptonbacteria bacterium]|nr:hypothetical protein [Candidatus Liptonbacteria bacterium]
MKKGMIGDVPGNVLGMLGDLAQKLQHGAIQPGQLELFLKKQNPFAGVNELTADWEVTSDRKADKDYCIWVRDRVEADEELKNKSANDLKRENIPGITLEERLLYELKFFDETGKHLDVQKITLCAGSRTPYGSVPSVYWHDGEVSVFWYFPDNRDGGIRVRAAVS